MLLLQGVKTFVFAAPLGKDGEICPMPHKAGQYASFDFEVRLLSALELSIELHFSVAVWSRSHRKGFCICSTPGLLILTIYINIGAWRDAQVVNPSAVGLQAVLRALEADCHLRVTEWSLRTHLSQVLRAVSLNSVGTAVQCLHLLVQGNMHLSYAKLALQDLEQPGSVTNRTWTISSHPSTATGNTPQFSITVKCIGLVSKWLHSKLKPGEACLHGWLPAAGKTAHVQSLVLLRLDYADPDCQSCHCASAQMSSAAGLHRAATWLLLPMAHCAVMQHDHHQHPQQCCTEATCTQKPSM